VRITIDLFFFFRRLINSGFVFFNNYSRHLKLADHKEVAFTIKTPTETVRIPEKGGINIKSGVYGVMPFNDNAGGLLIKYATVHPSTIIGDHYFYYPIGDIKPEFKLDNSNIKTISFIGGKMVKDGKFTYLTDIKPGKSCVAIITTADGKTANLVILSKEDAKYSYTFDIKGIKTLVLTDKQAFYDEVKDSLTIRSIDQPAFSFYTYPTIRLKSANVKAGAQAGMFKKYDVTLKAVAPVGILFKQVSDDAKMNKYVASLAETPAKPAYGVNYQDTLPYKTYELKLPAKLPVNVYDLLATFNYHGNTAAIYADGKIIADDYYSGQAMPFSLRRELDKLGKSKFVLQISPLMDKTNIYFEPGTPLGFKSTDHAGLTGITVKPVYQVVF